MNSILLINFIICSFIIKIESATSTNNDETFLYQGTIEVQGVTSTTAQPIISPALLAYTLQVGKNTTTIH